MQRTAGDSPTTPEHARLDWSVQTVVLRRLCADRPASLSLMKLVARGLSDDELRDELQLDEKQFGAELDAIGANYRQLSQAFFAHDHLKRRGADGQAPSLSPAVREALEIIGEALHPGAPTTPERLFDELGQSSFLDIINRIAGDLRPALHEIGRLPGLLRKSQASSGGLAT